MRRGRATLRSSGDGPSRGVEEMTEDDTMFLTRAPLDAVSVARSDLKRLGLDTDAARDDIAEAAAELTVLCKKVLGMSGHLRCYSASCFEEVRGDVEDIADRLARAAQRVDAADRELSERLPHILEVYL